MLRIPKSADDQRRFVGPNMHRDFLEAGDTISELGRFYLRGTVETSRADVAEVDEEFLVEGVLKECIESDYRLAGAVLGFGDFLKTVGIIDELPTTDEVLGVQEQENVHAHIDVPFYDHMTGVTKNLLNGDEW